MGWSLPPMVPTVSLIPAKLLPAGGPQVAGPSRLSHPPGNIWP